jgi:PhzF family phenazine biosynthesis protein
LQITENNYNIKEMKLKVYQIDSFTKEKFKGNPAGVVLNASGLSDEQMLMIARELNNSETAFLFPPDSPDCDGVIRYFTPKTEVPTCGHATIAAMYAKAVEENLKPCVIRYKTKVGILPFEIIKKDTDYQAIMTQGKINFHPVLKNEISSKILASLGIDVSDRDEKCPIQIVSTGHSKVMIGIKSREKLNSLNPNFNNLVALSKEINCNGYFVFTFDTGTKELLTMGRMFAPAVGINEDPVTGNANGPLGGYLSENGLVEVKDGIFEFNAGQGEKMGRFGIISVKVKIENNKPYLIQIKGDAVMVFRTEIEM